MRACSRRRITTLNGLSRRGGTAKYKRPFQNFVCIATPPKWEPRKDGLGAETTMW